MRLEPDVWTWQDCLARAEASKLTESDVLIWLDVIFRVGDAGQCLWGLSLRQDTRDAERMLNVQQQRGMRLEPEVWTWNDCLAWGKFILRFGPGLHFPLELQDMGPNADRRDADLMLGRAKALTQYGADSNPPASYWLNEWKS